LEQNEQRQQKKQERDVPFSSVFDEKGNNLEETTLFFGLIY